MARIPDDELEWGDMLDPENPSLGKYFPLHQAQRDIYNSNARFIAAIAGTGGGKTVTGPIWVAKQIQQIKAAKPNHEILGMIVAPTYKVLDRATVPTLINTFKGTALEGKYKEQQHLYILPDGGKIWCQGADNPGGLEGGQFDFIWGDEAGQFKYNVWLAIQGRTGAKQSSILLTTTPYGKNWLYSEVYKRFVAGDPNYYVRQWASFQNPIYPKAEYERAKALMTEETGSMRYDGEFMSLQGQVYPNFSSCVVKMDPDSIERLINLPGRHYGGIDFGWNDPFACSVGFLDENDILWIWWERYKSKTSIEDHANALPKLPGRTIKYFADHSPEMVLKLRRGGHKVRKANKAIVAGIEAVNARINSGRLKVIESTSPALIAEAEMYKYPDEEGIDYSGDLPDKNCDDHTMDELRYMIMGIDGRKAA